MTLWKPAAALLSSSQKIASRLKSGLKITVLGRPNVGKSSLINKIARQNLAIVTDIPGTTTDVLRVPLDINGYPVILSDTAGVRSSDRAGKIEKIGIERARAAVQEADLVLFVEAADQSQSDDLVSLVPGEVPVLKILNKVDLAPEAVDDPRFEEYVKVCCFDGQDHGGKWWSLGTLKSGGYFFDR